MFFIDNSSMHLIPISTSADQTSAAEENFNFSQYESSKADEMSVVEENSNLSRKSSAFLPSMRWL